MSYLAYLNSLFSFRTTRSFIFNEWTSSNSFRLRKSFSALSWNRLSSQLSTMEPLLFISSPMNHVLCPEFLSNFMKGNFLAQRSRNVSLMIPCTSLPLSYVLISKRYFVASHIIHHLTNTEKRGTIFLCHVIRKMDYFTSLANGRQLYFCCLNENGLPQCF